MLLVFVLLMYVFSDEFFVFLSCSRVIRSIEKLASFTEFFSILYSSADFHCSNLLTIDQNGTVTV